MSTADNPNAKNPEPQPLNSERSQNTKSRPQANENHRQKPAHKPATRPPKSPAAVPLAPGSIEDELGVPIPGIILAPEAWVSTAIKRLPDGELNFPEIFGRSAPIAIDIGCGNGRFVLSSAVRRPDWDHLAIDILPMVIRYATRRANQRGLSNCRFAACDGSRLLSQHCGPASVDEIHIYHPQPYSDSESQHRRMLTPEFMALVHRVLRPHGKLFLQTDNPAYWEYFRQLVSATMQWHDQVGPWLEDPHGRSRREFMAKEQGLSIYRGWAERRDDLSDDAMAELIVSLPQPTFTVESASGQSARNDRKRGNWRSGRRRR
jgi:tRNA (guanine-N7-)-methyltransferase